MEGLFLGESKAFSAGTVPRGRQRFPKRGEGNDRVKAHGCFHYLTRRKTLPCRLYAGSASLAAD
jgi:hypothetical protein